MIEGLVSIGFIAGAFALTPLLVKIQESLYPTDDHHEQNIFMIGTVAVLIAVVGLIYVVVSNV